MNKLKKDYFSISELATEMECDLKDVTHLIDAGQLDISVFVRDIPTVIYEEVTFIDQNDVDNICLIQQFTGNVNGTVAIPQLEQSKLMKGETIRLNYFRYDGNGKFYRTNHLPQDGVNKSYSIPDAKRPINYANLYSAERNHKVIALDFLISFMGEEIDFSFNNTRLKVNLLKLRNLESYVIRKPENIHEYNEYYKYILDAFSVAENGQPYACEEIWELHNRLIQYLHNLIHSNTKMAKAGLDNAFKLEELASLNLSGFQATPELKNLEECLSKDMLFEKKSFNGRKIYDYSILNLTQENVTVSQRSLVKLDELQKATYVNNIEDLTKSSDQERKKLLRIIGALVTLLAKNYSKFEYGENPNMSTIRTEILETSKKLGLAENNLSKGYLYPILSNGLQEIEEGVDVYLEEK